MILDSIQNHKLYQKLSPLIAKGLTYLADLRTEGFKEERVEIDGANLYALHQIYTTETPEGRNYEIHDRYIDIQYMVEGEEIIRYAETAGLNESASYDQNNDYTLFDIGPGTDCRIKAGDFAIFFPHDGHVPKLAADSPVSVKKVVLKVLVEQKN